jgi:hypothetical protein
VRTRRTGLSGRALGGGSQEVVPRIQGHGPDRGLPRQRAGQHDETTTHLAWSPKLLSGVDSFPALGYALLALLAPIPSNLVMRR